MTGCSGELGINILKAHALRKLPGIDKGVILSGYQSMKQELEDSEPNREAQLLYGNEGKFGIYQLKDSAETRASISSSATLIVSQSRGKSSFCSARECAREVVLYISSSLYAWSAGERF